MTTTPQQMAESKLGQDLSALYGWTVETYERLARYGADLAVAIRADRRENGPRARRVKDALRTEFGADGPALALLDYEDKTWQREGFQAPKTPTAERAVKAEYVALLMT